MQFSAEMMQEFKSAAQQGEYQLFPAGEYAVIVSGVEDIDDDYIKGVLVTFRVLEGEQAGRTVSERFAFTVYGADDPGNPRADKDKQREQLAFRNWTRLVQACGLMLDQVLNSKAVVNYSLKITVVHRQYNDKTYVNVTRYLPLQTMPTAPKPAAQFFTAQPAEAHPQSLRAVGKNLPF